MPKYDGATLGFILGLIVLNLLGALIGSSMGSSSDKKKRQWYRSAWLDSNRELTSQGYISDIFLKVPLKNLKNSIIIEKRKFSLTYEGKKIVLARTSGSFGANVGKKEFDRFKQSIEKYVL